MSLPRVVVIAMLCVAFGLTTADALCTATASCGSCVGNTTASCGYCKTTNVCMDGTAGGSFSGTCSGTNWTWFAQDCAATCVYKCPDGSCAASLASCNCTVNATVTATSMVNVNGNTNVANRLDRTLALSFASAATFAAACNGTNMTSYARVTFTVRLASLNVVVETRSVALSSRPIVTFAANYFLVDTLYSVTATYYDIRNRTSTAAYTFTAINPTAVVTVRTSTLLSLPLGAQLLTTVADPYGTSSDVASWKCAQTGAASCPTVITNAIASTTNATNSGLTIGGPIPAGTYVLWMTYKTVRSTNMTLIVSCNASDLLDNGECPGACIYTCPDRKCATSLATCNCTLFATINNATMSVWPTRVDPTTVLASAEVSLTATANYRQTSGSCSSFDFTPFMTMKWTMMVGSNTTELAPPALTPVNVSTIRFGPKTFTVGTSYTLIARFYNIEGVAAGAMTYVFTAVAPTPTVSLGRSSQLVVGPRNIFLGATIVDAYADSTVGTWSCTGVCGANLTAALSANGTNTGVFISGPLATGTSVITLTYKGVSSSTLTLVVKPTAVPLVVIESKTVAVKAPNVFLFTQSIGFNANVTYNEAVTLQWSLNGQNYSTESFFAPSKLALLQSGLTTMTENTIRLRAFVVADNSVYGESSMAIYIAPNQTVAISAVSNVDNATKPLLALSDRVSVTYAATTALSGIAVSYEVGYINNFGVRNRMVQTGETTTTFVCPTPTTSATLTVYVDMFVGSLLADTKYQDYAARLPDSTFGALNSQSEALDSPNPTTRAQATSNTIGLLASLVSQATTLTKEQNETMANMTEKVSGALADLKPGSGVSTDTVLSNAGAILNSSSSSASTPSQAAAVESNMLTVAENFATVVDISNVALFLNVIGSIKASARAASATDTVAGNIAQSSPTDGPPVVVESGGITMSGQSFSSANLANASTSTGSTTTTFPNMNVTGTISVAGTMSANGYASNGTGPATQVTSLNMQLNGQPYKVANLFEPIVLSIRTANPPTDECRYYNPATLNWTTDGLQKKGYTNTSILCATTHLTAFAAFTAATTTTSSAASVSISVVAAVVAMLLHLRA